MSPDETVARASITVGAPADRAFAVFTEQLGAFKPREHNLLPVPIADTVLEPHVGGAVYDRGVDGSICRWARVLTFEPPRRLVLAWDISPRWELETDPGRASEIEIRFVALDDASTRVEIEHRHLERHGAGWESLVDALGGPAGWPLYLERFAALPAAGATR